MKDWTVNTGFKVLRNNCSCLDSWSVRKKKKLFLNMILCFVLAVVFIWVNKSLCACLHMSHLLLFTSFIREQCGTWDFSHYSGSRWIVIVANRYLIFLCATWWQNNTKGVADSPKGRQKSPSLSVFMKQVVYGCRIYVDKIEFLSIVNLVLLETNKVFVLFFRCKSWATCSLLCSFWW